MKNFTVFFVMITAVLLCGILEKTSSQESVKTSGEELKNPESKPETTTPIIKSKIESTVEVVGKPADGTKPPAETKEADPEKESELLQKGMSEKEQVEIEDLKSRFRKLVEDEMKKFGVLEEPASEEEKAGEDEEVKDKKESGEEVAVVPEKAASEKKVEEPDFEEGKEVLEEEVEKEEEGEAEEEQEEEELEEEFLEEEKQEEVVEIAPAETEKPQEGKQKIALDFEDADIKEVITALAEITGINYIVDPKVQGKVNIHTSGEISVEDVLPILETIFEINNLSLIHI